MTLRPHSSTLTDTLFPCTTLCRSTDGAALPCGRPRARTQAAARIPDRNRVGCCCLSAGGRPALLVLGDLPRRQFLQRRTAADRSEEHTSEIQSLMRNSYAVFCLKKKRR